MKPDRQQPDHDECMGWLEGPVENRQAKGRQRDGDRTDIRIEEETPHSDRDHLADCIGRENRDQKKTPERQSAGEKERYSETDRQFEMDGEDDDENRVTQSAQESRVRQRTEIVVEARRRSETARMSRSSG